MGVGAGDRLARGGNKAAFPASEPGISDEKFNDAVKDFDPAAYAKGVEAEAQAVRDRKAQRLLDEAAEAEQHEREREQRRSDSNVEEAGVPGLMSAKDLANAPSK